MHCRQTMGVCTSGIAFAALVLLARALSIAMRFGMRVHWYMYSEFSLSVGREFELLSCALETSNECLH